MMQETNRTWIIFDGAIRSLVVESNCKLHLNILGFSLETSFDVPGCRVGDRSSLWNANLSYRLETIEDTP